MKGEGNQIDYGMRVYDPRIGKFLSVDPLVKIFPMLTPYQYASNTPIEAIDLDGEESKHYTLKYNEKTGKNVLEHIGDVDIIEKKITYERRAVHGELGEVISVNWMPVSRMAKNERTEYVYHGIENITAGHSGPSIPTALTWSFPTSGEMQNAIGEGKLNWYTSNEKGAVTLGLMAYAALEAESEVGAIKGLWFGAKAAKVALPSTSPKYNPNKPALAAAKVSIPASKNGYAPDFEGTPYLYPVSGNQKNIVKIKLTGSRAGDFAAANAAANSAGGATPRGYLWHHLDDFDPVTGTATLQLVETKIHQKSVPHTGSVKQYEVVNNITYKN